MGFLEIGAPMDWEESIPLRDQIKRDGLSQLLHIFNVNRTREDTNLKWGEEIEFTLVHLDHDNKRASICVDGPRILEKLEHMESHNLWEQETTLGEAATILSGARSPFLRGTVWHPEFGRHMIEATPNPPYELNLNSLLDVEDSMLSRRYKLQSVLPPNVYATSLTAFPRLGCEGFLFSENHSDIAKLQDVKISEMSCGKSNFIPDLMICPHPRFPTLVRNACKRRGVKTGQLIPVFQDDHTAASPAWDKALPLNTDGTVPDRHAVAHRSDITMNPVKDHIYLDHFGFGMGMSCLQMTFGTPNLSTARFLYDQMAVLAPIFLALSAATPMLRGWLSDFDVRWKVLEQGCDCRTDKELEMYKRTRYGPVSVYIADDEYAKKYSADLNDVELPLYEPGFDQLVAGGMDEILARHFASLWVRDPLVIYGDRVHLDNTTRVDHFENIQSTNWNSVRFKPPPPSVDGKTRPAIGWRVELRTPDLQLSDFENAMLASISQVLALAILKEGWRFYVPISATHANMETAHKRNAVRKGLFYFNSKITSCYSDDDGGSPIDSTTQMTLREIFMGSTRSNFRGLIPMMDEFVSGEWRHHRCSRDAVEKYRIYANFLRMRVLGQAPSDAQVLRQFVLSHPLYQGDSQITPALNYDICKYAVLSGFSLRPTETCWSCVPGCMSFASATRQVSLTAPLVSSWAKVPSLQNLLALPVDEGRQSLADVLLTTSSSTSTDDKEDHHRSQKGQRKGSEETEEDGSMLSRQSTLATSTSKSCSCGDTVRKNGGAEGCCKSAFDVELFLRMDQFSR